MLTTGYTRTLRAGDPNRYTATKIMKKYNIIYADPPWKYNFPETRAQKKDDYKTMQTDEICKLPVVDLAETNCALFIWGIWNALPDILLVIDSWGFIYKSVAFLWIKTNKRCSPDQYSFFAL